LAAVASVIDRARGWAAGPTRLPSTSDGRATPIARVAAPSAMLGDQRTDPALQRRIRRRVASLTSCSPTCTVVAPDGSSSGPSGTYSRRRMSRRRHALHARWRSSRTVHRR
jgi:hypothetical protein